jgi:hypothetical protein
MPLIPRQNRYCDSHRRDGSESGTFFAKIVASCVSGMQKTAGYRGPDFIAGIAIMMRHLPDHGLPLIQLKEQRRDLVVALQNRQGPISGWELMQIAAVQQAIMAFEEVIADLDALEAAEMADEAA